MPAGPGLIVTGLGAPLNRGRNFRENRLRPLENRLPLRGSGEGVGTTSFWAWYRGVLIRSRLLRIRRVVLLEGGTGDDWI